ncbi:Mov34/MPN/PAD-1 family protein [Lysobacter sp. MMG2]|uniref:Mov34/MPN/PAD-1 family protein n=1 Tax=Lysobacter sp. MMG2 TaxID=2801338 RepID=UPI001C21CD2C|nr:Mov34/MPN/PAD-1 family protein [Lysobacter sp. MMG2]MBU8974791.1 Mov34/MPN/PAD-1 family protein [Lysobacter sp. MMG2]
MAAVISEDTLVAQLPEAAEIIVLRPGVLAHLARYQQRHWWQREAGGQLFATLTNTCLDVSLATGPYRGDLRSRFGYRSTPASAQREIERQRDRGLYYCGDWHTHPQPHPRASPEDLDTIVRLQARSDLRLASVLMVIQGTAVGVAGVAVYVCCDGRTLQCAVESAAPEVLPCP